MLAGHVGLALTAPRNAAGGGGGPVAAISRFEFLSPTPIDVRTTTTPAGGDFGVIPRGNIAELETDTLGGASLSLFNGSTPRIRGVMANPGFENGSPVTRYTAFYVKAVIRTQLTTSTYVNDPNVRTSGGKTIWAVMIQYDYAATNLLELAGEKVCRYLGVAHVGSTFTLTADAGWYGAAAEGTVAPANCINSATRAYRDPEIHMFNSEREHVAGASTATARFVVRHKYGQNGRMFDKVRVRARDAQGSPNYTPWVDVTSTTLRALPGGIYEEYCAATVDLTNLTQGDLCRWEIEGYPLIGTASYVSTDYESDPADLRFPQLFMCDKTAALNAVAVVDAVDAGASAAASRVLATATTTPYASTGLNAAITAAAALNSNTLKCVHIYLRNTTGAHVDFSFTANVTDTIGNTAWYIQAHPDNNATVGIALVAAVTRTLPTRLITEDVHWTRPATNASIGIGQSQAGNETSCFTVRRATINLNQSGGTAPWCGNWGRGYWEDITYATNSAPGGASAACGVTGTNAYFPKVLHGIYNTTSVYFGLTPYTAVGVIGPFSPVERNPSGQQSQEGFIFSTFYIPNCTVNTFIFGSAFDYYTRGFYIDNGCVEWGNTTNKGWSIGGDNQVKRVENAVLSYVFHPGNPADLANSNDISRINRGYDDLIASRGIEKEVIFHGVCSMQNATKTDMFTHPVEGWTDGRVADWQTYLRTEDFGAIMGINRDPEGAAGRGGTPAPDNDTWGGYVRSVNSKYNAGCPTVADNHVGPLGGGGTYDDYQPTGASNPLYDMIPVGHQKFTYDMKGATRLTDGTGTCAHLERL